MPRLALPGLLFHAAALEPLHSPLVPLARTASTYSFGSKLECSPRRNDLYVVCEDGSIQAVHYPERPIGWELLETGDEWWYRVTQMGHEPKKAIVYYHGRLDPVPAGNGFIGTVVKVGVM